MKKVPRLPRAEIVRIAGRMAVLAGLSVVLGLSFNASNPIGIRWSATSAPVAHNTDARPAVHSQSAHVGHDHGAASQTSAAPPVAVSNTDPAAIDAPGKELPGLPSITWSEAKPLLTEGKIVLVDVRGRQTYDAGHIPGALSLPEWSTPAEIQTFQAQHGTNAAVVLYCGNVACPASDEMGAKLVKDFAFSNVSVLKGGYAEWQRAELGYDATPTRSTWAETKPLLAAGQVLLIDARPRGVYNAGHIPGALSLPEASPEEEFKALQKKYTPDQRIVVYCSDMKCAASMRVAVKLATWYQFRNVQFMPGGYQEWQQLELAPKPGV